MRMIKKLLTVLLSVVMMTLNVPMQVVADEPAAALSVVMTKPDGTPIAAGTQLKAGDVVHFTVSQDKAITGLLGAQIKLRLNPEIFTVTEDDVLKMADGLLMRKMFEGWDHDMVPTTANRPVKFVYSSSVGQNDPNKNVITLLMYSPKYITLTFEEKDLPDGVNIPANEKWMRIVATVKANTVVGPTCMTADAGGSEYVTPQIGSAGGGGVSNGIKFLTTSIESSTALTIVSKINGASFNVETPIPGMAKPNAAIASGNNFTIQSTSWSGGAGSFGTTPGKNTVTITATANDYYSFNDTSDYKINDTKLPQVSLSSDKKTLTMTREFNYPTVSGVTLSETSKTVNPGDTFNLVPTVELSNNDVGFDALKALSYSVAPSSAGVTYDGSTVTVDGNAAAQKYTITATSTIDNTKKATCEVTVNAKLLSVAFDNTSSYQKQYEDGENFNLSGVKIKVKRNDGKGEVTEDVTASMFASLALTTGMTSISGTLGDKTFTIPGLTVNAIEYLTLEGTGKTDYLIGESLDVTGLSVKVKYTGDNTLYLVAATIKGDVTTTGENKTYSIEYKGKNYSDHSAKTFNVYSVISGSASITGQVTDFGLSNGKINVDTTTGLTLKGAAEVSKDGTNWVSAFNPHTFTDLSSGDYTIKLRDSALERNVWTSNVLTIVKPDITSASVVDGNSSTQSTVKQGAAAVTLTANAVTTHGAVATYTWALDKTGQGVAISGSGNTQTVTITDDATPGVYTITATTQKSGVVGTYKLTVVNRAVTGIEVINQPTTNTYVVNTNFVGDGMKIRVNYDSGSSKNVVYDDTTKAEFTISPLKFTVSGSSIPVTVTYGGKSTTVNVNVVNQAVETLENTGGSLTETNFLVDEKVTMTHTTNVKVKATFNDNTVNNDYKLYSIDPSSLTTTGPTKIYATAPKLNGTLEKAEIGEVQVYNKITANVQANSLKHVGTFNGTDGAVVLEGNLANSSSTSIATAEIYKDEVIIETVNNVSAMSEINDKLTSLKAGNYKVVITNNEIARNTITVTFKITQPTVSNITVSPSIGTIIQDGTTAFTGTVIGNKNDSGVDVNKDVSYSITPIDAKVTIDSAGVVTAAVDAAVGNVYTITATSDADNTKQATATVKVAARTISSIAVTNAPSKTSYVAGQPFDTTGMVVTATYNNGKTGVISDYTVNPSGGLTVGTNKVVVSKDGKTADVNGLSVVAKVVDDLRLDNETLVNKNYDEGATFSLGSAKLEVKYNDSSTYSELTLADVIVTPRILSYGTTSVKISFGGKEITVSGITVRDAVAPVITLKGENPYVIQPGTAWVDPGYTVVDNHDSNPSVTTSWKSNIAYNASSSIAGDTFTFVYIAQDAAGNTSTVERQVNVRDDIVKPVITLTGSTINIYVNDAFVDPGFTANDETDGDITSKVTVSSNVDTTRAGTYEVTYTVSDNAGNKTVVKRSVYVTNRPIPATPTPAPVYTPEATVKPTPKPTVKPTTKPNDPIFLSGSVTIKPLKATTTAEGLVLGSFADVDPLLKNDKDDAKVTLLLDSAVVAKHIAASKGEVVLITVNVPDASSQKQMKLTDIKVEKSVFAEAAKAKKGLVFTVKDSKGNEAVWTFDAAEIASMNSDLNMVIIVDDIANAVEISAAKIKEMPVGSVVFQFLNRGKLPAKTTVTVNVKKYLKDGDKVVQYYFDGKEYKLVVEGIEVKDGKATLVLEHTSSYVLSKEKIAEKPATTPSTDKPAATPTPEKAEKGNNMMLLFGGIGLAALIAIGFVIKKSRE